MNKPDSPQGSQSAASLNALSKQMLDAGHRVHSALGPGLLESAYEVCLAHELNKRNIALTRQATLPVIYGGLRIDAGYRIDMLIENQIIVELKAVERLPPVHEARLLSCLRLAGKRPGLLINFNVERLRDGIKRMVNHL